MPGSGYSGGSKDNPPIAVTAVEPPISRACRCASRPTRSLSHPAAGVLAQRRSLVVAASSVTVVPSYAGDLHQATRQQEQASPACRQRQELDQKAGPIRVADSDRPQQVLGQPRPIHQNYARQNKLKYNYYPLVIADAISGSSDLGHPKAEPLCHGLSRSPGKVPRLNQPLAEEGNHWITFMGNGFPGSGLLQALAGEAGGGRGALRRGGWEEGFAREWLQFVFETDDSRCLVTRHIGPCAYPACGR